MFKIPPLGGQRPSELLARMHLLCPERDQQTRLFKQMFYERLPADMQNQLAEDNTSTVGELAARANKITQRHTP